MKQKQKVFGIVSHRPQAESGEEHSHEMFLVMWDGTALHTHHFSGVTSYDVGHSHSYAGTTAPAPTGVPHTHKYYTVTSRDNGHTHVLEGVTGPDIPLPGGGHYHFFSGYTTVDGAVPHSHAYSGRTTR